MIYALVAVTILANAHLLSVKRQLHEQGVAALCNSADGIHLDYNIGIVAISPDTLHSRDTYGMRHYV